MDDNSNLDFEKEVGESEESLNQKFARERREFIDSLKNSRPCILVAGPSGAGKSTLINTVMKKNVARTGYGRPVTQTCDLYEDGLVRFYDTKGYESSPYAQTSFENDVIGLIEEREKTPDSAVDIVWYCVSAGSGRFTDFDASLVRKICQSTANKPLAIVLTKQDHASMESADALRESVRNTFPEDVFSNIEIFETYDPQSVNEEEARNLDRALNGASNALFKWTQDHLDDAHRQAFVLASRRGFDEKEELCEKYIRLATGAAATIAASPVPFSDAPLLVATQIALMAKIFSIWGIDEIADNLTGTVSTLVTSSLGRSVAGSLAKLIPGVGTVAGAAINTTVASSITYAFGKATVVCCRKINDLNLNSEENVDKVKNILNSELVQIFRQYFSDYMKNGKSED
jgi:uncharacterized protein (DUF697 family)/GTP-binding protein EngB required for normal cell division